MSNSPFGVAGGHATVSNLARGKSTTAYLPKVSSLDTEVSVQVGAASATPLGLYTGLDLRRQDSGDRYRVKAYVGAGAKITLSIARVGPNGLDRTIALRQLPITLTKGQSLTLDAQVFGSSAVTVSARAWATGAAEPAWQVTTKDASGSAIAKKGSVGLWGYESSSGSTVSYTLDAFAATSYDSTTPVSTAPTSSSTSPVLTTSSAAPTTGAAAPTTSKPAPTSTTATTTQSTAPSNSTTAPSTSAPTTTTAPAPPSVPIGSGSTGAAPVGTARYPVPSGALFVSSNSGSDSASGSSGSPLRTVASAVSRAGQGSTIVLRGGTYHESIIIPVSKSGLTIEAYPGEAVWFDGTSAISGWTQSGSTWVHHGWTTSFDHSASFSTGSSQAAFINPSYPLAAWPDQVLANGTQLAQVWPGSVTAGTFAVDYGADTITVGSNPNGLQMRAADLERAFVVQASGVTLQGFGVRNYATPLPRMGAVVLYGGHDTVRDLAIVNNSTQGLSFGGASDVGQYLTLSGNGMTGVHGNSADGLTLANSLIVNNNSENFNPSPSSGGIKITRSRGVTISQNTVKNNINTKQIWLDESVVGFTISSNTVAGSLIGIDTELSDTGIIANNSVTGGTLGLYIFDTGNVKVYNNSLVGQTTGSIFLSQDARRQANASDPGHDPRQPIPDATNPWLVRNVTVSNNTFGGYVSGGAWQFYALDKQTYRSADSMNLTIKGNYFVHKDANGQPSMVGWGGGDNHTITRYETPTALQVKDSTWQNLQLTGAATTTNTIANSFTSTANAVAIPLPADVAAAVGQAVGTRHIGVF